MNLRILCVGKLKERYWRDACAEYEKRLRRYIRLEIAEVDEAPDAWEGPRILRREGEEILKRVKPGEHLIALAVDGARFTSQAWAAHLGALAMRDARMVMVIGGSLGLSAEVLERANETVSFSGFTFPHQMMRVVLLEQVYRGCKIRAGEAYHK